MTAFGAAPHGAIRGRGERWRARYASDPDRSRGRMYEEREDPLRSPFQRDRDRILHSTAFRRLKHKTQVFVQHEDDHVRTRLTHTLEVAQVARTLARSLGLDEDLVEALALAHDLGHPPFGHAGERALDAALAAFGGFDHNAQSLRIVTRLERRYPSYAGLNLTWETLEGLAKHNGPVTNPGAPAVEALSAATSFDLGLDLHAGAEAQIAAISDDIAYIAHDVDDGLRSGLLTIDELRCQPITSAILADILDEFPGLDRAHSSHAVVRRLMSVMIRDVLMETARRLETLGPEAADDIRRAVGGVVDFSDDMRRNVRSLKAFMLQNVYRNPAVLGRVETAEMLVADLFRAFTDDPGLLPADWAPPRGAEASQDDPRRVTDYIAGMTDRYAVAEHRRLFDATPDVG